MDIGLPFILLPTEWRQEYMEKNNIKFAVLGAGHGGTAMAGHLSLLGVDVSLYNRSANRIRAIQNSGGIEILTSGDNIREDSPPLSIVTSDIQEAIQGRDVLMVVLPATGHRSSRNSWRTIWSTGRSLC